MNPDSFKASGFFILFDLSLYTWLQSIDFLLKIVYPKWKKIE